MPARVTIGAPRRRLAPRQSSPARATRASSDASCQPTAAGRPAAAAARVTAPGPGSTFRPGGGSPRQLTASRFAAAGTASRRPSPGTASMSVRGAPARSRNVARAAALPVRTNAPSPAGRSHRCIEPAATSRPPSCGTVGRVARPRCAPRVRGGAARRRRRRGGGGGLAPWQPSRARRRGHGRRRGRRGRRHRPVERPAQQRRRRGRLGGRAPALAPLAGAGPAAVGSSPTPVARVAITGGEERRLRNACRLNAGAPLPAIPAAARAGCSGRDRGCSPRPRPAPPRPPRSRPRATPRRPARRWRARAAHGCSRRPCPDRRSGSSGGTPLAHWLSATGRDAPAIVMPVSAFWSVASATGWSTRRHSAAGTLPTEGVTVSAPTSTAAPAAVVTVTTCVALTAATFIGATSSVAGTSLSGGRPALAGHRVGRGRHARLREQREVADEVPRLGG